MSRRVLVLILAVACTWTYRASDAAADDDGGSVHFSKEYETDKRVGIGVLAGVPAGVSGKFFFTAQFALDLGVGAYLAYRDRDGLHLHMDFLWHPFVAVEGETFLAPLYVGLGGRLLQYDDEMDETLTHIGARVPVGISFDLGERPFDIFMEAAFVIDPVMTDGAEGPVDVNFGAGGRFFF